MAAPLSSEGIVTVSYKMYRDTYRNTYQISQYVSFVEKVYGYTPKINNSFYCTKCVIYRLRGSYTGPY